VLYAGDLSGVGRDIFEKVISSMISLAGGILGYLFAGSLPKRDRVDQSDKDDRAQDSKDWVENSE
jgi:hypothetical protein